MPSFTRGATIKITATFYDVDGNPVSPSSANAYLSYRQTNGQRSSETIALSQDGTDWIGTWDSRIARQGTVQGHVRTPEPLPISASNFSFELQSNQANP